MTSRLICIFIKIVSRKRNRSIKRGLLSRSVISLVHQTNARHNLALESFYLLHALVMLRHEIFFPSSPRLSLSIVAVDVSVLPLISISTVLNDPAMAVSLTLLAGGKIEYVAVADEPDSLHFMIVSATQVYCTVLRGHTATPPGGTVCWRAGTSTDMHMMHIDNEARVQCMSYIPESVISVQIEMTKTVQKIQLVILT